MDLMAEKVIPSDEARMPTSEQLLGRIAHQHSSEAYDKQVLSKIGRPQNFVYPLDADQTRSNSAHHISDDNDIMLETRGEEHSSDGSPIKIDRLDQARVPSESHLTDEETARSASFYNASTPTSSFADEANQADPGPPRLDLPLASDTRGIATSPNLQTGDSLEPHQDNDRWKDELQYQHVRMLGHGGSASVELVVDVSTNSFFARKIIRNVYSRNIEEAKRKLLNEIRIMRRLESHDHIVGVHSTRIEGRELTMILDPAADGGDLADYLQNYRDQGFHLLGGDVSKENKRQNRVLSRAFGCLASALDFIHHQTVRHKDIKPQNILIHKGKVMYTDFGLSYDFGDIGRSTTTGNPQGITRRYCAPEVAEWGRRNTKSDIFSLGCVFIEIVLALANDASYDQTYERNFQEVVRSFPGGLPLPSAEFGDGLVWEITDAINEMMRADSTSRPSASRVTHMIFDNDPILPLYCPECLKAYWNIYSV
ncbi:hypothetical protein J4E89_011013 [Alternaria sp. Ai002NY15]|nr:hypothetical protein J4E89_011013 [Alternaria sp. Ai002NY15]